MHPEWLISSQSTDLARSAPLPCDIQKNLHVFLILFILLSLDLILAILLFPAIVFLIFSFIDLTRDGQYLSDGDSHCLFALTRTLLFN